ncbi:MAG: hypothetical protein NZ874_10290 [Fimbriimonadales bacterium]|nr:hypothetical protein [Fimbriimonadales bacterium]
MNGSQRLRGVNPKGALVLSAVFAWGVVVAVGCDLRAQCSGLVQDPSAYLWDLDDYPL